MKLPTFKRTPANMESVRWRQNTGRFIRTFWFAATPRQRKEPGFLWFITASAWTNEIGGGGEESTREWRNRMLASYLGVEYDTETGLAAALARAMPRLTQRKARSLVSAYTGISRYYGALRPNTKRYVLRHAAELSGLYTLVSSARKDHEVKIAAVATQLAKMPRIKAPRWGTASPFNALTPVLACLDPVRRFPIMNQRTAWLLRHADKHHDADGVLALYGLIGSRINVRDSFELDVYSLKAKFAPASKARARASGKTFRQGDHRPLSLKSELDSYAALAAHKVTIRKEHNRLTNRFRQAVFPDRVPKEASFDLLLEPWKTKRKLLIEAKTGWRGATGRAQIRQAIGQLIDYRLTYFPEKWRSVDLAVLVPTEPPPDIKKLLASVHIAAIWFNGRKLKGTVPLPW
jgi:hypothetical protein